MDQVQNKTIASISDMARMVGLSRARFYQLVGTTFPFPLYAVATRRPFYPEELQAICLAVRRKNCGVDGKPILFYSRRSSESPAPRKRAKGTPNGNAYSGVIDGLKSLGLVATALQVEQAVKQLFPNGVDGLDQGQVLRSVFLHMKRQNRADNVGR